MDSDTSIEALMVRYQQGDRAAATALVNRLSPQLHRFFLVQVVSRRYADDLLQETWMRIHQIRHTYTPGQSLLPWLYAIARHIRVDHYRQTRRAEIREQGLHENRTILQFTTASAAGFPDVDALLATLPESQREVITMLKVADMSLEEVARATSSSVGSVKQKAHRAYEQLRKRVTDLGMRTSIKGGGS
jgi:RNA polymerase sigma-70 factor (ECF subfamily)